MIRTTLYSDEVTKIAERILAGGDMAKTQWDKILELPPRAREQVLAALAGSEDDGAADTVSLEAIAAAGIEPLPAADTARHTRHSDPRDTPVVALATALVDGGEIAARAAGGIHPAIWRAMTIGTTRGTRAGSSRVSDLPTLERGQFSPTRIARAAGLLGADERLSAELRIQVNAAIARLLNAAQEYAARVITAASDTHDAPAVREFHAPACRCVPCVDLLRARAGAPAIPYAHEFAPAVDPSTGKLVGLVHEQVRALYALPAARDSQARQRAHLPSAAERAAELAAQIERGAELARLIDERHAARRARATSAAAPAAAPVSALKDLLG